MLEIAGYGRFADISNGREWFVRRYKKLFVIGLFSKIFHLHLKTLATFTFIIVVYYHFKTLIIVGDII